MSTSTIEFTEENFSSEVESSDTPVLVDFWAEWCGPCKMLSPTIDTIAEKYKGKVKVGKVNVEHNPTIVQKYGVRNIPTVLVFKNGEVVGKQVGVAPKSTYTQALEHPI